MNLDPARLQVLLSRLTGIAETMGAVLRRAAHSPNIKERADCSAALFTPAGELLVQAEHIPVHLGSMPASVLAAIDAFGDSIRPGEQVVLNDPFAGGTHLNDVTLVAPCFDGTELVGWVANRAHHADLGGAAPGSIPADATDVHQEGLRIPPLLYGPDVRALFEANSRTPAERVGDLDAQVGANAVGVTRFAEVHRQHRELLGAGDVLTEIVDYGERRIRTALADLPDGTWRHEDVLDSTGAAPDQQHPAKVVVTVTVAGDTITFDFTGTDPQSRGNVNAVEAVTVSAVAYALRAAVDPTLPANGGVMRPVTVVAPAGTVVAALPPAAVGAGNVEVSQRVADVCLGALAQPCAARVPAAGQGTMNNLLVGGAGWVYYETVGGGQGGRPGPGAGAVPGDGRAGTQVGTATAGEGAPPATGLPHPGQSGIQVGMTNTQNTPIEALERAFPMRVLRYRLRRGSGGAGFSPGGEGIERDLQLLEDCTVSLITERRVSRPPGLWGGEPGAAGENWLLPGGDESRAERLPDKCTIHLRSGDVVRMLTPGGAGWGPAAAAPSTAGS